MVAQHPVYRPAQRGAQLPHDRKCRLVWPIGRAAIIPGQHTGIMVQPGKELRQSAHRTVTDVGVEIADLQEREAVEGRRQCGEMNVVVPDLDALRVALPAPIEPRQLEQRPHQRMNRVPVLDMKEIEALAEYLRLVILFDAEALPCVQTPQPSLQFAEDIIVHGKPPQDRALASMPQIAGMNAQFKPRLSC